MPGFKEPGAGLQDLRRIIDLGTLCATLGGRRLSRPWSP
jgi:hypothetical protein